MLGPAAALLAFLADRVMKTVALSENGRGAFVFKATLNSGAVFSLPIPTPAIAALSALVMAGILVFTLRSRSPLGDTGAALVLLGGLSNLIDRIRLGAVVDIFSVGLATFNVSDMMVVLGALLILRSRSRKSAS